MTLDLPDEVYDPLARKAGHVGRKLEEVATEWLIAAARREAEDALLQLAGVFRAEVTDVADRHDYYIGQALVDELHGRDDG
jgi:hypothetical protein